jgi:AcrR family transcriptional regulator
VREKIIETALERFMQNGIRNMTILKLTAPLGISTKTVYKYFKSKEELLSECLNMLYTGYFNELRLIINSHDNPVNKLLLVFRNAFAKDFGTSHEFFHDLNYYYPELQNAAIERTSKNNGLLMVPLIEQGIREGYFHGFIDPMLVLDGISTLYASITRSEKYKNYKDDNAELFKNLVEVYIRGLCTPKGLEVIENNPYHKD